MNKHPVSELQEIMAKRNKPLPTYVIENSSIVTGNKFICMVNVNGIQAVGFGSNKQNAKLEAATKALARLKNPNAIFDREEEKKPESQSKAMIPMQIIDGNYIGKLNELTSQHGLPSPTYSEFGANEKNEFIIECVILNNCSKGFAPTKKQAKQHAAREMLALLSEKSISKLKQKMPDLVDLSAQVHHKILPSDEEIVEKFKLLTSGNKPKKEESTVDLLTGYSPLPSPSSSSVTIMGGSTDDLWKELQEVVPVSNLQVLQTGPMWVLALNFGDKDEKTVMEMGESYERALGNLLNKAIILAKTL